MVKYYISIDGGTTNTRVALVENTTVLKSVKANIGARKSIGGNAQLCDFIRGAISELLTALSLREADISCIIASGMITSEFGLYELAHLHAPVGIKELHDGMARVELEHISPIPFYFIPGVKTVGEKLEDCDMMRGEETELFGLCDKPQSDSAYVLPGSHSKIVVTDADGRIARFFTMLSGEMISALSQNTILKDAVDLSVDEIDEQALCDGYSYAVKNGLNEALFKVRVGKNLFGMTREQAYSFFIGATLSGEIQKILSLDVTQVIIGGKSQLKRATAALLSCFSTLRITVIDDATTDASLSSGQIRVFEY